MSHFTVLVIGDDVEQQLAPYDEELQVPAYRSYWDSAEIRRWEQILTEKGEHGDYSVEAGTLLEPAVKGKATLAEIAAVYNARYAEDDDRLLVDDGGIYSMSTYNPKSKWDWYTVGGRWMGYFKMREFSSQAERWNHAHASTLHLTGDEVEAVRAADAFSRKSIEETVFVGRPGVFDNEPKYDADIIMKGDIDIEGMRAEAGEKAGETWDKVDAIIRDLPEARPWVGVLADCTDLETGEPDVAQAREIYSAQPRVEVLRGHDELVGLFGGPEDFQMPREQYVTEAELSAIAPYAYVKDGQWHGRGKMGWFGMSKDEQSQTDWAREFNDMLDSLPVDAILTLVDCHI